jgi:hypothetical protein
MTLIQLIITSHQTNALHVALSGLVIICLLLDPKFLGSNLAEDDGYLTAIKIHSTTSVRGEVKPSVPCSKILQHVKEPYKYEQDNLWGNSRPLLSKVLLLCY